MKVIILADAPAALTELCGVSMIERLLRTLQRVGVQQAAILSRTPDVIATALAQRSPPRSEIRFTIQSCEAGAVTREAFGNVALEGEMLLVLPGDAVWDERLLRLLLSQREEAVLVDSAPAAAVQPLLAGIARTNSGWLTGAAVLHTDKITLLNALDDAVNDGRLRSVDVAAQPSYSPTARRELRPLWIPAPPPEQRRQAERLILDAAQKGALDLPARVHGPIETFLVAHLCKTSITPNQMTAFCNVVAWAAAILFATGHLGWGTALALSVGILDGVDGKLARVKVQTTKGGQLEHWLDKGYELAWAFALAYHFRASGALPGAFSYLLLFLAAEGVDGLAKLSVIRRYGRLIDELSPLDRAIRFLAGRRNIYVWILTVGLFVGAPAKAFVVIAWWEVASAVIHVIRALWVIVVRPIEFSAARSPQSGYG
jgi:phosphatidylglycerophosphate synthase